MNNIGKIVITDICTAGVVKNPVYKERRKINRSSHGLCFAKSGRMVYYHNGNEYISDKNHILFIPMGESYISSCTEAGEFPLINFHAAPSFNPHAFIEIEAKSCYDFIDEYNKLEKIMLLKTDIGHYGAFKTFYEILKRVYNASLPVNKKNNYEVLKEAEKHLSENYTDPFLTNEVLAGKCHVSEVYFRRIFKEKYGISPKQHIQNMRIKKAQALLRSEYMSIKAIAEMSGYASVYHFSRAFKRVSGYAPTEYIKTFGDSV